MHLKKKFVPMPQKGYQKLKAEEQKVMKISEA